MKTRRLTTILTSAYLSAMLATSVAPIRNDATLAATIDPLAAQKALQGAVSGLDAAGWLAASTAGTPPAAQPTPKVIPPPKADPVMTAELMARLIKLAQDQEEPGMIPAQVCAIFNLCDGTVKMPVKMVESEFPEGHYFTMPWTPGSKDIIILKGTADSLEVYLTDKSYKLRAAAVYTPASTHLITNEKASEKFKAELALFAKEAADLPPTGTVVPGNS